MKKIYKYIYEKIIVLVFLSQFNFDQSESGKNMGSKNEKKMFWIFLPTNEAPFKGS